MKVKSVKPLNDGMTEEGANRFFDKIEAFGSYGFCAAHSYAYSVISFWTAYIRTHYPAEYFAASLSIVGEDKISGLVKDARECGIEVLPPDINLSSEKYVIANDKSILAPFNSVKGISETIAQAIVRLRENHHELGVVRYKRNAEKTPEYGYLSDSKYKGRFDSFDEFKITAGLKGSKVNVKVVDVLNKVGAFASIEPNQLPANHFDRRKMQKELLPGLIIDAVKSDRTMSVGTPYIRAKLIDIVKDYRTCKDCDLCEKVHPAIRCGKNTAKFMVITDTPNFDEEKAGTLLEGSVAQYVKNAITSANLKVSEGYYTTLVKACKNKGSKYLTNDQINACKKYLEQELELLKPSIIVALGSTTIKYLLPDVKNVSEVIGANFYDDTRDTTIVCGINPAQCVFEPSKKAILVDVFKQVAEMID